MSIVLNFLDKVIYLWLEISPYLLFGMIVSGLLHIFLSKEFISRQLGSGGIISVIKATLLGVPLPVCSCGVIPIVSSLQKEGAHKSSILAFLVSTPTTGVDSIFVTYSLLGPLFAIFRPLSAMLCGIALGVADYFVEKDTKVKKLPKHKHKQIHPVFHWREFFRYSFFEIPQDIGRSLILGIIIGGLIAVFIPAELFSAHISTPLDFLLALLIGIPLYVCATGSIPIAVSLLAKGFSPGAGLIFLIVGPATNAITLSFVRTKLGKKSFYLYLANIIIVAVLLGFIFNYLWFTLGANQRLITGGGKMIGFEVKLISAILMLILIGHALIKPNSCKVDLMQDMQIKVPDIHCAHCRLVLESKLKQVKSVKEVFVDIENKVVYIKGTPDKQKILSQITAAGYTPESS